MANEFSIPPRWNPTSLAIAKPQSFSQNFGWEPGYTDPITGAGGGWVKTGIGGSDIPPNFVQSQLASQYTQYGSPEQTPPSWVTAKPAYRPYGSDPFARSNAGTLYSPAEGVYVTKEELPGWYQRYYENMARTLALNKGNAPEGQTWAAPRFEKLQPANYASELFQQYPDVYEPSTGEVSPFINPDIVTSEDVARMLGLDMGVGVEGTKPAPTTTGDNWKQDTSDEEPITETSEEPTFQPAGGQEQSVTGQPLGKAGMSYGQRLAGKSDTGLPKSFAAPEPTPIPAIDTSEMTEDEIAILRTTGKLPEGGTTDTRTTDNPYATPTTKRILIEDPVGSGKYWYKHLQYNTKTGNWDTAQISLEPAKSPFPEKKDISYQHFVGKDGAIYSFNPITQETKVIIPAPDKSTPLTHQWPNPDGTMKDVTQGAFESLAYLATQKLNAEKDAYTRSKDVLERKRLLIDMVREMNQLNYANKWNEYQERVRQEEVRSTRVSKEQESFQAYMLGAQGQGIQAGNLATSATEAQNKAQQERINAAQATENLRARMELEKSLLPFRSMGQQQPVSYRPYRQ